MKKHTEACVVKALKFQRFRTFLAAFATKNSVQGGILWYNNKAFVLKMRERKGI